MTAAITPKVCLQPNDHVIEPDLRIIQRGSCLCFSCLYRGVHSVTFWSSPLAIIQQFRFHWCRHLLKALWVNDYEIIDVIPMYWLCFCVFFFRYIRSERSVILINFCLSIISSNALILIGQTQTRNKVTNKLIKSLIYVQQNMLHNLPIFSFYITISLMDGLSLSVSIFLLSGCLYSCGCVSALLLPVLFLLGSHGGMAVLHGRDWPS